MQYKISSLLAEDYPQLAFEVFSAAWHRITTTGIHGHAHMLFYLPPWLEAIDFAVLPSDATVSLLEVRHPNDHSRTTRTCHTFLRCLYLGMWNMPLHSRTCAR
jgi:hypothetical protein